MPKLNSTFNSTHSRFAGVALAATALALFFPTLATAYPQPNFISIHDDEQEGKNGAKNPVDAGTVNQLILQLGSAKFSERQEATERLWLLGPPVRVQLEEALKTAKPDVARRLKGVTELLKLGLDSNTNPDVAQMILYFSEDKTPGSLRRQQILTGLFVTKQFKLLFILLERIEDPRERDRLFNSLRFEFEITQLAQQLAWDQMEFLLDHPISQSAKPSIRVHKSRMEGRLETDSQTLLAEVDRQIEELGPPTEEDTQAAIDELNIASQLKQLQRRNRNGQISIPESKTETPEEKKRAIARYNLDKQIVQLIAMLRLQNQFEQAASYVDQLSNHNTAFRLKMRLLMEQNKWKEVLKLTKLGDLTAAEMNSSEDDDPSVRKRSITLLQQGVLQIFAEDREGLAATIKQFENRVAQEIEANKEGTRNADDLPFNANEFRMARDGLAKLWLADGNLDQAKKYFIGAGNSEKKNGDAPENEDVGFGRIDNLSINKVFSTLIFLQRYEEAFQLIGLEEDVSQRFDWLVARVDAIKAANKVYEKSRQPVQAVKINQSFEMLHEIAATFESLGMTEEAAVQARYLESTISPTSNSATSKRAKIIQSLMTLHRYDDVWEIIRSSVQEVAYPTLFTGYGTSAAIAENKEGPASYFFHQPWLKQKYPDAFERLQVTMGIINSPLAREDFDWLALVNEMDTTPAAETRASALGSTQGHINYNVALAMKYHGLDDKYQFHLARAADIGHRNAKLILADTAMEKRDFRRAAELYDSIWMSPVRDRQAHALVMAAKAYDELGDAESAKRRRWCLFGEDLSVQISLNEMDRYKEAGTLDEIVSLIKISMYMPNRLSTETMSFSLSFYLSETNPDQAATQQRIYIASNVSNPNFDFTRTAIMHCQERLTSVRVAIQNQDFKKVETMIDQLNAFRPGDPELGEVCFPMLDRAGQSELADRLFARSSGHYFDILEKYPESPLHQNNFAWMCATSERQLKFSQRYAENAVKNRPDNSSYLDTLAEIRFQNGDTPRAIELIEKCLSINPTKPHYLKQAAKFRKANNEINKPTE